MPQVRPAMICLKHSLLDRILGQAKKHFGRDPAQQAPDVFHVTQGGGRVLSSAVLKSSRNLSHRSDIRCRAMDGPRAGGARKPCRAVSFPARTLRT
jgi:hypothetical protein